MEWQPIETAPKTGEEIIVAFGRGYSCASPISVFWDVMRGSWRVNTHTYYLEITGTPMFWMRMPDAPE